MTNKVVYNGCYGGFGLSVRAIKLLEERGVQVAYEIPRHHPELVRVVEELGDAANGRHARLFVEEIEGNKYRIDEYDGSESVVVPNEDEWTTIE